MLDMKLIREHSDLIKANCARRKCAIDIDNLLELDADYRKLAQDAETMRAERNRLSKLCGSDPDAREKVKNIKVFLGEKEAKMAELEKKIMGAVTRLPNLLAPDVPDGADDTSNVEIRKVGAIPTFDFKIRDHQELGELLDILDIARGAKVAGTGFYYWKGKGAMLAQSLYFYVQRFLVERGFTMFMTPCAAKERTLFGTGYLPFFADQTYTPFFR